METEGKLSLAEVFVSITDPRQAKKVQHDLVELLVVAVNAVLVGADTFVEIELWARERLGWLRSYLRLKHGIPSHDTFGRLFGLIDPDELESAFRRWVSSTVVGPISVSIGLASATGAENSEDEVVRLADQRLYQAKANGRNRVEISA